MSTAISVKGVTKRFRIPLDKSSTLKHRITHLRSASRYNELLAVNDVSFDIEEGSFVGIIGHNGSGKSTLLKMLAGIYRPNRGSVTSNGLISPFLELGVGFNPELTAVENIYVNGSILGLTRAQLKERVDSIIDFAEVRHRANDKLKNFSSGMQVRLAFSVAIQAEASILLMDEVLAVGDASFQEKCFEVFARYKREGKTVVLVTHDLGSIENHCDRAILLHHGKVEMDAAPGEVVSRYKKMVGQGLPLEDSAPETGATTSAPAPVDLGSLPSETRWGTREVEITHVELLDREGVPSATLDSDASLRIAIHFLVNSQVPELVFGMAIHRSDGMHICGDNTKLGRMEVLCPPAGTAGTVTYTIPGLHLTAGRYLVSASIYDGSLAHPYDHINQAFPFRVYQERDSAGLLALQGKWETDDAVQAARLSLPDPA